MFLISTDQLACLFGLLKQYYALTQEPIKCESVITLLRSKDLEEFIASNNETFKIIIEIELIQSDHPQLTIIDNTVEEVIKFLEAGKLISEE